MTDRNHRIADALCEVARETGAVLDRIDLPEDGPSPHGLSMRNGQMWYCDANLAGKLSHATRPEGAEIGRVVLQP